MACKYNTMYNPPEVKVTESGRGMSNVYGITINPDTGRQELVKTGETNTYEVIQAHLEQTKIENILARATIDPSVLQQRVGEYGDFTEMPTSLLDANIKIMGIKNEFESLPNEIRQKFNYSVSEYVAAYGGEEWAKILGLTQEEKHEVVKNGEEIVKAAEETKGDE